MNYHAPKPNVTVFSPEIYQCRRAKEKLVLDGRLDKSFWENADWTVDFADIEGDSKPKPRFQTRAKILWDDEAIYFGAELMGDEIWSHVTKRDDVIFNDNDFEIFIDPDTNSHCYCEFEMNALNTMWDLLLTKPYRDGGKPMNGFDIKGIETATYIDGELNNPNAKNVKWSCEIKMPFETLLECCGQGKDIPKGGDFWRVGFSRVQWTVDVVNGEYKKRLDPKTNRPLPEDNWVWAPTGIINMHYPELWGFVFFCDGDEEYAIPKDEYIKWELRKIYYAQQAIFDETGAYSDKLSIEKNDLRDLKIQAIDRCFEASCKASDGVHEIAIFHDGRTVYR